MNKAARPLRELATLHSLLTAYTDAAGRRQVATDEALLGVLRATGVEIDSPRHVSEALRRKREEICSRLLEPIAIAWNGRASVGLNLKDRHIDTAAYEIALESGEIVSGRSGLVQTTDAGTMPAVQHKLRISRRLPIGYHDLRVKIGRHEYQTRILAAPKECYSPPDVQRSWGVFLPIYALCSKRSWGAGDFTDFEELTRFIESRGGAVVATLPLLATFLDQPFEPSPYSPASRLFWSEFYVDVTKIPELQLSKHARQMTESSELQNEIAELRRLPLVDYRRQMALKRRVLEELARTFFDSGAGDRRKRFEDYVARKPAVRDYATFRAANERQQKGWPVWPERLRQGNVTAEDFDESSRNYHLYSQWVTSEQLRSLAYNARANGRGLYLDFPLGVHPDGYDVWRERDSFALNVAVGAPPDPFFTKGQNWGFPPLHPDRLRADNYRYFIDSLRHHMQYAGVLRLDHVMALHRLYWIPAGTEATHGVYVRYPAEELYAIIAIESHRHKTMVVGEDLGTVPGYVRTSMNRHDLRRMYVLQYEVNSDSRAPAGEVIPGSVASINTHDMPPFGAFWNAADVDSRLEMGLLDEKDAETARDSREMIRRALVMFLKRRGFLTGSGENPTAVHDACMAFLSRSDADVVLVNLEDLWLEQQPQNTPGTSGEQKPNWRRKARKTLEQICNSPSVTLRLKTMDLLRRKGR